MSHTHARTHTRTHAHTLLHREVLALPEQLLLYIWIFLLEIALKAKTHQLVGACGLLALPKVPKEKSQKVSLPCQKVAFWAT